MHAIFENSQLRSLKKIRAKLHMSKIAHYVDSLISKIGSNDENIDKLLMKTLKPKSLD